jgi:hypothetical protein
MESRKQLLNSQPTKEVDQLPHEAMQTEENQVREFSTFSLPQKPKRETIKPKRTKPIEHFINNYVQMRHQIQPTDRNTMPLKKDSAPLITKDLATKIQDTKGNLRKKSISHKLLSDHKRSIAKPDQPVITSQSEVGFIEDQKFTKKSQSRSPLRRGSLVAATSVKQFSKFPNYQQPMAHRNDVFNKQRLSGVGEPLKSPATRVTQFAARPTAQKPGSINGHQKPMAL